MGRLRSINEQRNKNERSVRSKNNIATLLQARNIELNGRVISFANLESSHELSLEKAFRIPFRSNLAKNREPLLAIA